MCGSASELRRRLRPVDLSLPVCGSPVVDCQRSDAYFEAVAHKKAPPELWSTTALCGYDPERSSGGDCAEEAQTAACGDAPLAREESESTVEAGTDEAWNHAIVFFLPDAKGQQDDPFHGALFEVAAQEIARFPDVDCRHLEWPSASLATDGAVAHVLLALREAVAEVQARTDPDLCPERFRVFLVGHSFGGAVAIQAACDLPWLFQSEGGPSVSVAGVCTLDTSAHQEAKFLRLDRLQNARALLIASGQGRDGPADPGAVEDLEASRELFALLPATRKEMVTYCRSKRRGDMVVRLVEFVTRGLIGS
mmetsp:Transcript_111120/g.310856  ORF Transcript_111120/g.310856 Transcript_111120/m.310856 type:complete len:308 (+) Transcript_111120:98-1021(+)